MPPTHEVTNQPPPLVDYDLYAGDAALGEAVARYGAAAAVGRLHALGTRAGTEQAQRWATEANTYPPVLRTHDRYGHRIDEVDFHPSWHELLRVAIGAGLHAAPWAPTDPATDPASHVARAAGFYLWSQVEGGHGCPVSMTYAVVPALRAEPDLAAAYLPGLTATVYDPGLRPAAGKAGLLAGMGMTEKQGGSDVRANTTRAERTADGSYRLTGHKWFCSAPMCDLFLVLAQATEGLTCFLVPRVLPDGSRNTFRLQRLKDKLGNRSNASSEVEFDGTVGWRVGPAGRGVPTIIEMVGVTRLDCVLGSAATMRAAVTQAIHHATHRQAFGRPLRSQPLMRAVLADLAVESEAATALAIRLASAVDSGATALGRLATAVAKFWVCKRAGAVTAEALECLGGNGYVEDSGLPRLYREAPLNSIWEGSGNVIALDVLRAITRQPESVAAFLAELDAAAGADSRLDAAVKRLRGELGQVEATVRRLRIEAGTGPGTDPGTPDELAGGGRRLATLMALCLQGALLVRHAPPAVADAFCATRLDGDWAPVFGTLPPGLDQAAIVDRAAAAPDR